jgi:hypothetical protein
LGIDALHKNPLVMNGRECIKEIKIPSTDLTG